MKFKIGFTAEPPENKTVQVEREEPITQKEARRSVVQVHFAKRNMTLAYYNDKFDLKCGDLVYVDGKLEGMQGKVVEVNYNFKIRLSDYQRVIAVADTAVKGKFFMAGSHFVTFDRDVLPAQKALSWYKAPASEEDEFVCGEDGDSFYLDKLSGMNVSDAIAERGCNYYAENRVRYICLDGAKGYAIVEGNNAYEVEFEYDSGKISNIVCSCFCSGNCKHEFAAMMQLKETLGLIEKNYAAEYERTGYFAAISKVALFSYAVDGNETGSFTL